MPELIGGHVLIGLEHVTTTPGENGFSFFVVAFEMQDTAVTIGDLVKLLHPKVLFPQDSDLALDHIQRFELPLGDAITKGICIS